MSHFSLMEASYRGHLDAVKKLKEFGAQWSPRDNAGTTALHWAVDGGHVNVVDYILQEGVSVSACAHVCMWLGSPCVFSC